MQSVNLITYLEFLNIIKSKRHNKSVTESPQSLNNSFSKSNEYLPMKTHI